VLLARALRELAQLPQAAAGAPPSAADAGDDRSRHEARRERREARARHVQKRALAQDRAAPERASQRPVETLSGCGEVIGQALRARGVSRVGDLIWLLPSAYIDEREVTPLAALTPGCRQVTEGTVISARPFGGGRNGRMSEVWLGETLAGPRTESTHAP
jgi:hypothetical protein